MSGSPLAHSHEPCSSKSASSIVNVKFGCLTSLSNVLLRLKICICGDTPPCHRPQWVACRQVPGGARALDPSPTCLVWLTTGACTQSPKTEGEQWWERWTGNTWLLDPGLIEDWRCFWWAWQRGRGSAFLPSPNAQILQCLPRPPPQPSQLWQRHRLGAEGLDSLPSQATNSLCDFNQVMPLPANLASVSPPKTKGLC